jgi:signal transduction histidine kinase/CheY-like chemotaxis protein
VTSHSSRSARYDDRPRTGSAANKAADQKSRYYSLLYQEMAERKRAEEHLRQYNALLATLSTAQLQFVAGAELAAIFRDMLISVLAITATGQGLLRARCGVDEPDCAPYHEIVAAGDPDWQEVDPEAGIAALHALADRVMASGQPVYVGSGRQPAEPPAAAPSLPLAYALLAVPIVIGQETAGVITLASRRGGFSHRILELLQPLLPTCAQLIEAHRNAQRRKAAEQALAEERALLAQRVADQTAELRLANDELARAARSKDEFLATMNHELRTPLNAILLYSDSLHAQLQGALNERQLRAVSGIRESGYHLLSLINDILDVAKMDAGKLALDIAPCLVETVCQASLRLVSEQARKKELQVSQVLDPAVTSIDADERRLKQILVNLLGNAVKFTPERGSIGLEVVGDAGNNVVRFTVWDTGIGIAAEDLPKLFQPFVQLNSGHERQHSGSGLGLVLVYRMVEMHGGSVSVESKPGAGSRFTVALPWQRPSSPEPVEDHILPAPLDPAPAGEAGQVACAGDQGAPRQPLILVAEDNESNLDALSDLLQAHACTCIVARTGSEAVKEAKVHRPDLILMDVHLPEMNGLEATRRIRAEAELHDVPIIALTALVMPGDRDRCLAAGIDEYMSKPIYLPRLTEMLDAQLQRRRPPRLHPHCLEAGQRIGHD